MAPSAFQYDAHGNKYRSYSPGIPLRRSDGGPWLDLLGHPMPGSVPTVAPPPSEEVDRRAQALRARHPGMTYSAAMRAVLAEDRELLHAYAGVPAVEEDTEVIDPVAVRDTVHAAVQAYQAEYPGTNYGTAMVKVFELSPTLKAKYAAS